VSTASFGRLGHLLRWLGLTLVVLLALQLLVLLGSWNWSEEGYRQLLMDRLVTQSPMALVGLLLMLFGSGLDHPAAGLPHSGQPADRRRIRLGAARVD
jgi:hypothetical protein